MLIPQIFKSRLNTILQSFPCPISCPLRKGNITSCAPGAKCVIILEGHDCNTLMMTPIGNLLKKLVIFFVLFLCIRHMRKL